MVKIKAHHANHNQPKGKNMFTRAQYMNNEITHRQYYGQFVTPSIKKSIIERIGFERIVNSEDEHFNDIPLELWDRIGTPADVCEKMREAGDFWTMAGACCINKEAAKQILEGDNF